MKELKAIYHNLPRYWEKLKGIPSRLARPMPGVKKTVFELEDKFAQVCKRLTSERE